LKPYWGKPAVRNFRGDDGNVGIIRSPVRAIALPDRLYGGTQWTAIDWKQRQYLRRHPLAQALHAFYSTHAKPHPIKLATLKEVTGSRNSQPASFKRQTRQALKALVDLGFLTRGDIEGDLVTVQRATKNIQ
jgi:hypothetical protein